MKTYSLIGLLPNALFALLIGASTCFATASESAFGPAFSIESAPTTGDWQRFHTLSSAELKDFWAFHNKKNLNLHKWAWQWRLGWLRACGNPDRIAWCRAILKDGLVDGAVVVRAEAATQFGTALAKVATQQDLNLLATAFKRRDNFRNGKPLFVCERILDALVRIENPQAKKIAIDLARKNKKTLAYWKRRNETSSAKLNM